MLSVRYVGHADVCSTSLMPCSIAIPSCETDICCLRCPTWCTHPSLLPTWGYPCDIQGYQAAKDIGASHDALANLLELTEEFVNRLKIYTEVALEQAMVELIVKMMVQLLHVLGLVTKEIKRKSLIKIGKKLLGVGENDIDVALQKLNQLTLIEGRTTMAHILRHTDGLIQGEKYTWLVIHWVLNIPPSRWKGNAR